MWRKIEKPEAIPVRLSEGDECYYARRYVSGGKFGASEANQLIRNFKKPPDRRSKVEWKYKVHAIEQFAAELGQFIERGSLCAIPGSKRRDDRAYDSRLDDVLDILSSRNRQIIVERPFEVTVSHRATHDGGERSAESFYAMLRWTGFKKKPRDVILIDDVITTGCHFKACQRMIQERFPRVKVYGVFWAKVFWIRVFPASVFLRESAPARRQRTADCVRFNRESP